MCQRLGDIINLFINLALPPAETLQTQWHSLCALFSVRKQVQDSDVRRAFAHASIVDRGLGVARKDEAAQCARLCPERVCDRLQHVGQAPGTGRSWTAAGASGGGRVCRDLQIPLGSTIQAGADMVTYPQKESYGQTESSPGRKEVL